MFVIIIGAVAYMPWNLTVIDVSAIIRKYAKKSYLDQVKIATVNITDATWKNSESLETKSISYRLMLIGLMFRSCAFSSDLCPWRGPIYFQFTSRVPD